MTSDERARREKNTNTAFPTLFQSFDNMPRGRKKDRLLTSRPTGFGGFGAKPATPAFGGTNTANTSSNVFGSGGTGFGGFGNTTSTTTPGGFGSSTSNTTSLFGAKTPTPVFGGGGGGATSSPFGGATTGFGSSGGSAFGASQPTAITGNVGECQGTGSVPFQAHVEKEPNAAGNAQVAYQNIVFQQPYQKFSNEELRLADYAQGRRYGNSNQQAGAFGTATNFGGFGNNTNTTPGFGSGSGTTTGSNLFGSSNTTPSAFGQQPATTAFGSNNSTGGLFGQKTATTGFGATPTPSNNLFGSSNTGNSFGTNTNTNAFGASNTGGGLFGTGNTNNDNKPATGFGGGAFGTQPAAAANTGFGQNNTGGGLFGGNNNQSNTGTNNTTPSNNLFGGGFGGNNNQQQANSAPSLFGAPKPATPSLFGSTPSTGGLFGGTTTTPANSGFGNSAGNTGGLFGSQNNKSAPTSNLFGGNTNANTTTPTPSLFGGLNQNNQQQQQTPSLFGGQQQKPGLFGTTPQSTGSTSLFGGSNNNNSGGLFGQSTQQQQQQPPQANNSIFNGANSFLGNSQQSSQPQSLTASLNDNAAFGTASLFSNLASTEARNPGPIATPLSSASKQKKSAQMPLYKLNPASSFRFNTPQKRGLGGGYGFSYSTSPSLASSSSTPPLNFSNSLHGNSLNRSLVKSMSTSSLRRQYSSDDSILAPNAFSGSSSSRHFGSSSSNVKKLVINKNLRNELFAPPKESPKKNVRFHETTNGTNPSPLKNVQSTSSSPTPHEQGLLRSSTNGTKGPDDVVPEMQEVRGNEVAIVVEEPTSSAAPQSEVPPKDISDLQDGEYWSNPTIEAIKSMSRVQRQKVKNFTVGRVGYGQVTFEGDVDLSTVALDEILGGIVTFAKKGVCTVYSNDKKKPPRGKGLNVPSTITLEHIFPKKKAATDKFLAKLKKIADTEFVKYDSEAGEWTFKVKHFTTYGLDDDEDDEEEEIGVGAMDRTEDFGQSTLSAPPDTPTPRRRTPREYYQEESFVTTTETTDSHIDDTFDFKTRKVLPGAFDDGGVYEEDEGDDAEMGDEYLDDDQSFLDNRSVGSQSELGVRDSMMQDTSYDGESVMAEEREVAGSFYSDDNTTGQEQLHATSYENDMKLLMPDTPALMRARLRERNTPSKSKISAGDDWMKSLQGSISPRKQDRNLLKQRLANGLEDIDDESEAESPTANRVAFDRGGIATSIDLMNSLFGQAKSPQKPIQSPRKSPKKARGFVHTYSKVDSVNDEGSMTPIDREFHDSLKPSWGPDGLLVFAAQPDASAFGRSGRAIREKDGLLEIQGVFDVSDARDIRFAKFSYESSVKSVQKQKEVTTITKSNGIPSAQIVHAFKYTDFAESITARNPSAVQEKLVWELAGALFDPIEIPEDLEDIPNIADRLRKERVSNLWQKLVEPTSTRNARMAKTHEEKAIACLSSHKVIDACNHLLAGENFHLATLVALLGNRTQSMSKDIKDQLQVWNSARLLPEINTPIRALYEILAGNVCVCSGKKDGPREDRFDTFVISTQFGLDWRQAFGLRLWYAISAERSLEEAVKLYAADLSQDREQQRPCPWYVEQKMDPLWEDPDRTNREDLLWGLLKLYSNPQKEDLQSILRPENSQLSPLDVRLAWQLGRALIATGRFSYGSESNEKEDTLTLKFASQLTSQGDWLDAAFILLHISSEVGRTKAIKEHISRHAGMIGDENSPEFQTLTSEFKVPASWVWEAKALYMRSVRKNPRAEVECLLQAGSWENAHTVFSSEVAPTAIIERDYPMLKKLLRGFKGKETKIDGWHLGGELYSDYLSLVEGQKDPKVLDRLLASLPAIANRQGSMMETIAIQEIGGAVAKTVLASQTLVSLLSLSWKSAQTNFFLQTKDRYKVLRLPLTEDKCLQHTVDLSLNYYKAAMAVSR